MVIFNIFPPLSDHSLQLHNCQFHILCNCGLSLLLQSESEVIPYSTDTSMSPSQKLSSLPKLINLEQRPPSQCSSPTDSGINRPVSFQSSRLTFSLPFPGRFSKHKDKFYIEWEKMQVMIDKILCWQKFLVLMLVKFNSDPEKKLYLTRH